MSVTQVVEGRLVKNPVAVWNMNSETYTEKFEDKTIIIEPGHFVTMSRSEAVMFLGRNPGMDELGGAFKSKMLSIKSLDGAPTPTGEAERAEEAAKEFKCHLDGMKFDSQAELDIHLATHTSELIKEDDAPQVATGPVCPFCQKSFDTALGLRSHMNVHVKEERAAKE